MSRPTKHYHQRQGDVKMSENTEALLKELVRSTNRTTHAVRAFVRFLFIQLSAITLALFVFNVGNLFQDSSECSYGICPPNELTALVAGLIWIVGVIWSSSAGWSELAQSDISPFDLPATPSSNSGNVNEQVQRAFRPANEIKDGPPVKPLTVGGVTTCGACGTEVKPGWNVCVNCRTWVERD